MFRYKSGVRLDYDRQGYVYFASRQYRRMSAEDRKRIRALCRECGGEYWQALLAYVTTDASVTELSLKHHLSPSTLHRVVRRYYEAFPDKI